MKDESKARLSLGLSVVIFGSIGIFRRYIPFSSGFIAFVRGITGAAFLLLPASATKKGGSRESIKKNFLKLFISGAFIGFNWILLFEAYNYTTVAAATLCYYMAPIIVILLSPLVLKEKLTVKKIFCVFAALSGMIMVSGILSSGFGQKKGAFLGLGAAVLYACVMIINQKITDISAYDKTITQLFFASVVILPYTLIFEHNEFSDIKPLTVVMLLTVGIVHTGFAYALYFGSMDRLSGQTVALFSYIDPIVAVMLSALVLKEKMGVTEIIGSVLVLGAAAAGEIDFGMLKKRRKEK